MLPRNHCNETDIETSIPVEGTVSAMQGKMIIEKKRKAPGCKDDCGLTYSEYKQMMMRPKDPTRKRRYHHVRHAELENAYGLRFPSCFFALYEFAVECDPQVNINPCGGNDQLVVILIKLKWLSVAKQKARSEASRNLKFSFMTRSFASRFKLSLKLASAQRC